MDVQQRLDSIVAAVEGARSMPMSASCVVNRADLLAMLEEVRQALPGSLAQAQELLGGRERMVAEAQQEAHRIIEGAQAERGSLVSGTEIVRIAQEEGDRLLSEARREAEEIRAEADDYVDSKLANFEVVLSKTIGSVERGREKLLGSGPGADTYGEDYAEDAPERTTDPEALRQRADEYVDARLGSVAAVLTKTLQAVGRGRQKLLGHRPADELGAHMAAQDAAGAPLPGHTDDAGYLAGLAGDLPAQQMPAPQVEAPPPPPAEPAPYYGQQAYALQDPYYPHQQPQPDPYYPPQQPVEGYDPNYYSQQPAQPPQHQAPQHQAPQHQPSELDETSFFDTSMIDLEQVRQYEQQYDQGYGYGHRQ